MQQLTDSLLEGIKKTPGRFAAPFVINLVQGTGYQFPLANPRGPALLVRNKSKTFFVLFPETRVLLSRLNGRKHVYLYARVVFPVLVLGEEVEGWDSHKPLEIVSCSLP